MGRVEWPSQSTDSHANTVLDLSTFVRLRLDQTLQLSMFGLDLEPRIDPCGPSILAATVFWNRSFAAVQRSFEWLWLNNWRGQHRLLARNQAGLF